MQNSEMRSVFVCHAAEDKPMVGSILRGLEGHGVTVWLDEAEMLPGDRLEDKISEAIDRANWFCIFLTPNSVGKEWVRFELARALEREAERGEHFIVPVLLFNCVVPSFLRGKLYVDMRDWGNYELSLEKLVRIVRGDTAVLPEDFASEGLDDPGLEPETLLSLPSAQAALELNLRSNEWRSRTIRTLARNSGLTTKQVIAYCEAHDHILPSPILNATGEIYYGVRWKVLDRYKNDESGYGVDLGTFLGMLSRRGSSRYAPEDLRFLLSFYDCNEVEQRS